MAASYIGEPEWPTRELKEIADVGEFGKNPLASLSAVAGTALDAATKAAGEIGQNLQQIDRFIPRIPSLDTLMPQGGALDKLEGLRDFGQTAVRRTAGMDSLSASIGNALSGAKESGPVLQGMARNVALPGSLPSPLALPGFADHSPKFLF
jgi:hypothetical protein